VLLIEVFRNAKWLKDFIATRGSSVPSTAVEVRSKKVKELQKASGMVLVM